jgi:hypothetical protein
MLSALLLRPRSDPKKYYSSAFGTCLRTDLIDQLLLLLLLLLLILDCKWVVNPVAAVTEYGTTNNRHKQTHITTTNDTYITQHNTTVWSIY